MKRIAMMAGAVMLMGIGIALAEEAQPAGKAAATAVVKKQTACPIMGGQVNAKVFADYEGKRIYFCCSGCPAEFKKDPAKYIAKLEKAGITLDKTPVAATEKPAAGTKACCPKGDGADKDCK